MLVKDYYYLAQAQLALKHPNEAVTSALTAYDYALQVNSPSTASIAALVLSAKKLKWESRERTRLRERSELLTELEDGLIGTQDERIDAINDERHTMRIDEAAAEEEINDVRSQTQHKIGELRTVFAVADPVNMARRVRSSQIRQPLLNCLTFVYLIGGSRLHDRFHHVFVHARPGHHREWPFL